MKRSTAPSQLLTSTKRTKFIVPTATVTTKAFGSGGYNRLHRSDSHQLLPLHSNQSASFQNSLPSLASAEVTVTVQENCQSGGVVTQETTGSNDNNFKIVNNLNKKSSTHRKPLHALQQLPTNTALITTDLSTTTEERPEKRYFNVVWCKRSSKKHKKWEGDAILSVATRSVHLIDTDGKEIGKASGYKLQELATLKEGETLVVGGKEIEILDTISNESFMSGKCFINSSTCDDISKPLTSVSKPGFSAVKKSKLNFSTSKINTKVLKARFDPQAPGGVVLSRPPLTCLKPGTEVVDVVVDPHLSHFLRPHQKQGVMFLYECIMGFRDFNGQGAILADEMGLGKTLQVISLLWTLLKQNPISTRPVAKKALIVTPGSLVKNWSSEFKKWLGNERLSVFAVSSDKKAEEFKKTQLYPVMIVSYEMFVRYVDVIRQTQFDVLVCDEGHRLKNGAIKTASLLKSLSTKRRIVVTGTPVQNDLQEFYTLVDFCNPGILGTSSAFHKVYEMPILASKQPKCTSEEEQIGKMRAKELNKLTSSFILRRTSEINEMYLPTKVEYVVFCKPSLSQVTMYKKMLSSCYLSSLINYQGDNSPHLLWIADLKKICNYPPLLLNGQDSTECQEDDLKLTPPPMTNLLAKINTESVDVTLSGKLAVLSDFLAKLHKAPEINLGIQQKEKIVLVSNYTKTLDILQKLCVAQGYLFCRLDGQTPTQKRLQIVDKFNSEYSSETVFLLSSKAGGVGLNLVGANRLVLFDIDWNPANDLQAMARIWRDGQKKKVHIYRLLTTGTIEEKIYQRQVSKQGLGNTIINSVKEQEVQFSKDDLRDLFMYRDNTLCDTHDMLSCNCDDPNFENQLEINSRQLLSEVGSTKSLCMSELNKWHHASEMRLTDEIKDDLILAAAKNISYIFTSASNI